jgi:hypothetical protein
MLLSQCDTLSRLMSMVLILLLLMVILVDFLWVNPLRCAVNVFYGWLIMTELEFGHRASTNLPRKICEETTVGRTWKTQAIEVG